MERFKVRGTSLIHSLGVYELCNFGQVSSQSFLFVFLQIRSRFFKLFFFLIPPFLPMKQYLQMEPNMKADQSRIAVLGRERVFPLCPSTLSHPQEALEALNKAPRLVLKKKNFPLSFQVLLACLREKVTQIHLQEKIKFILYIWNLRSDQGGQLLYFLDKKA